MRSPITVNSAHSDTKWMTLQHAAAKFHPCATVCWNAESS